MSVTTWKRFVLVVASAALAACGANASTTDDLIHSTELSESSAPANMLDASVGDTDPSLTTPSVIDGMLQQFAVETWREIGQYVPPSKLRQLTRASRAFEHVLCPQGASEAISHASSRGLYRNVGMPCLPPGGPTSRVATFMGGGKSLVSLFESPDGVELEISDVKTGEVLRTVAAQIVSTTDVGLQIPTTPFNIDTPLQLNADSLVVSNDATTAAILSETEPVVAVIDLTTGRTHLLIGRSESSIAFHPTDRRFVTAGADGAIRIYEQGDDGISLRRTIQAHNAEVTTAAFSTDNGVISGSIDGTIVIWDVPSGIERGRVPPRVTDNVAIGIGSLALTRGGTRLAVGYVDDSIHVFDIKDQRPIRTFSSKGSRLGYGGSYFEERSPSITSNRVPRNRAPRLAFSGNGERLLVASRGWLQTWDIREGDTPLAEVDVGQSWIRSVEYSRDMKHVIVCGRACVMFEVAPLAHERDGCPNPIEWYHHGTSETRSLRVPDAAQSIEPLKRYQFANDLSSVFTLAFSHDSRHLASVFGNSLVLVDAKSGAKIYSEPFALAERDVPTAIGFSRDGVEISVQTRTKLLGFETASGASIRNCPLGCNGFTDGDPRLRTFALHPNARCSVGYDSLGALLGVHECQSGQRVRSVAGVGKSCRHVAISPDGLFVASTGGFISFHCNEVAVVDSRGPRPPSYLCTPATSRARLAEFSRRTNHVAVGYDDGALRIWNPHPREGIGICGEWGRSFDFDTEAGIAEFTFDSAITALAYSPDESLLAVGTEAGTLLVLNLNTGTILFEESLPSYFHSPLASRASTRNSAGHPPAGIVSIAFSPDGTQLACGSERQVVVVPVASFNKR